MRSKGLCRNKDKWGHHLRVAPVRCRMQKQEGGGGGGSVVLL